MDFIDMDSQQQFNDAIQRYDSQKVYSWLHYMAAIWLFVVQVAGLYYISQTTLHFVLICLAFLVAYVLADFINGLVHMLMDNCCYYKGVVGAAIANFHLHHAKLVYSKKPIWQVYFYEAGFKIWLCVLSIGLVLAVYFYPPKQQLSLFLVCLAIWFVVLSCVAELSHYLCHNSKSKWVRLVQRKGLLLHPKHHQLHHRYDNTHYAFLNGMTDPLLNLIAKRFMLGYKHRADVHALQYLKYKTNQ